MALLLSERGVGTLEGILKMRVDLVMHAWHFAEYRADFETTDATINSKDTTK